MSREEGDVDSEEVWCFLAWVVFKGGRIVAGGACAHATRSPLSITPFSPKVIKRWPALKIAAEKGPWGVQWPERKSDSPKKLIPKWVLSTLRCPLYALWVRL